MIQILVIFALFYLILEIKFRPRLDWAEEKLILWYTIKSKVDRQQIRDYIVLFLTTKIWEVSY